MPNMDSSILTQEWPGVSLSVPFLLCRFVCCVTVWHFVLCSVHAIPGRRPDGPRLRRNVKGPRNPMSISIINKYVHTHCDTESYARAASRFTTNESRPVWKRGGGISWLDPGFLWQWGEPAGNKGDVRGAGKGDESASFDSIGERSVAWQTTDCSTKLI